MKLKQMLRAGVAAGISLASAGVWATPCDSALSSYESYVSLGFSSNASDIVSNHPECFAGSPGSSRVQINATSFNQAMAISGALSSRLSSNGPVVTASLDRKGMAAGNGAGKWNVWGNINQNDTHQSYTAANGFKTKSDADVLTTVVGVDYSLSPTMVVGVSGAFDNANGSGINMNPGNTKNRTDTTGYVIAPYLGIQLSKELSLDASIGMGQGKFDTNSNTEADADRWFGAANLSYNRWFDNIQLTGKLSYLHGVEDYGDIKNSATGAKFTGTDAKNTVGQLRLGMQAGYWLNGFMPYAAVAYTSDIHRDTTQFGNPDDPVGRDAWLFGLGVNYFSLAKGVSGGVAFNQEVGRSRQTNHSLVANINLRF